MLARDVMTRSVTTVAPDSAVKMAARLLVMHGFTLLPVVDDERRLLGVVTEADLIRHRILPDPRALISDDPPTTPPTPPARVDQVMTTDPVPVHPEDDLAVVAALMLDRHLRAVPVVDGDLLVGVLTRRDLLRTIARDDASIARDLRLRLAIACRRSWEVDVADGLVTLRGDLRDPAEVHVATVIAEALPGVVAVTVAELGQGP